MVKKISLCLFIFHILETDNFWYFLKNLYFTMSNKIYNLFLPIFLFLFFNIRGIFWLLQWCDYKDNTIAVSTCAGYCFWCYRGNISNYVKYYRRNLRVPELQLSTLVSTIQFSVGTSHTTPLDYIVCKVPGTCSLQVSRERGKPGIANHVTRIMLFYQPWHSSWM